MIAIDHADTIANQLNDAKLERLASSLSLSPRASQKAAEILRISPQPTRIVTELREIWQRRELIANLVWRDLTTRYRQTVLGAAWAIIQPACLMIVMSVCIGRFLHAPTDNCPYMMFVLAGLLPWQYFASSVSRTSNSVLGAGSLIKRVYFPRVIVAIAAAIPAMVDLLIALALVAVMSVFYHVAPTLKLIFLPAFMLLSMVNALGIGIIFAALQVRFRDVSHIVPFLLQILMFVSPIAYSRSVVPQNLKPFYDLNPMVGLIDGFRWCLLPIHSFSWHTVAVSTAISLFILVAGIYCFRSTQDTFVDYL